MKKTQFIEWIGNIRKTWVTFLSIATITALGIAVYLGINYAAQGLKDTNNAEYQEQKFWDFRILSALGFSGEEVAEVGKLPAVGLAAGTYEVNGKAVVKGRINSVRLFAITKDISTGHLEQGRMPETSGECVVSRKWAALQKVRIGDTLKITASSGGKSCLNNKEYKVTGIVDYIDEKKRGMILIPEGAFNTDAFNGFYTGLYVRIKNSEKYPIYSKEYKQASREAKKELEKAGLVLEKQHYKEVKTAVEEQLVNGRTKLADARAKLDEGKKDLDQAASKIKAGEQQAAAGEQKLANGKKKMEDGEKQLAKAAKELDAGYHELLDGRSTLDVGWEELETREAEFQAQKAQVQEQFVYLIKSASPGTDANTIAAIAQEKLASCIKGEDLSDGAGILDGLMDTLMIMDPAERANAHRSLASLHPDTYLDQGRDAYEQYTKAVEKLSKGEETYRQGLEKYQEGLSLYEKKEKELADGKAEYSTGAAELAKGRQQLEEGKAKYESKLKEYEEGEEKYADSLKKYEKQEKMAQDMHAARWINLDRNSITSYSLLRTNADDLKSLGLTIALTFILVAALVCYSSISRMVEEQRKLLGVQKALGFFAKEIFIRYLGYAAFSTAVGVAAGIMGAYFAVQPLVLRVYQTVNGFRSMQRTLLPLPTLIVGAAAMCIAFAAVCLACLQQLKLPATILMKEEAPAGGKHRFSNLGMYRRLPLFTRVIISNMFSDKKRIITTLAGVAGCMTLLVAGFTLKFAANQVPDLQYKKIVLYDKILNVKPTLSDEKRAEIQKIIEESGGKCVGISQSAMTYKQAGMVSRINVLGAKNTELSEYMRLEDADTGERLKVPRDGVLLSKGTADHYQLTEGDSFHIMDALGNLYELRIRGIFKNYFGEQLILEPGYYQSVFGKEMNGNRYFIKLPKGEKDKETGKKLLALSGVLEYGSAATALSFFNSLSGTLDSILVLMIVMSAVMAVMILFNLYLMHIRQKSRELAVMRVNGYTVRETKRYVGTETMVITAIGILIGAVLGSLLGDIVRRMLQNQMLQIKGGVQPMALLVSAAITMLFSFIINSIALGKIKKLKLNNVSANE